LLSYILFEKYIYILALEMASPGNQHCANCIGTLSFTMALSVRVDSSVSVISSPYFQFVYQKTVRSQPPEKRIYRCQLTEPVSVEVDGDERRRNSKIVDQREQFDEER